MVTFWSLVISIFPLILLLAQTDASPYRSLRQNRDGECPDPAVNACLYVTCENGGQCVKDPTTVDCFKCQCTSGYTGRTCEAETILPTGCNPRCQNGGVCNINVCQCLAGYSGTLCEIRDYCLPTNPCQNGGRCASTGVGYQCDCIGTGYDGASCTNVIPTNPCTSSPCQNGGVCSWDGVTMNCLCVNSYTGTYCQIDPIPCASTPCQNGGTCELLSTNTYGCTCPEEFIGAQCETSVLINHICVTAPGSVCLNGGTCTVKGVNYLCACAVGWSGTNCQTQDTTSSCNPNPCGIHGACYEITLPVGPTVHCSCENQWTGKFCDVDLAAGCPVGYCYSGVCQMIGSTPYCTCTGLYTGQRCDTLIDPSTITTPIPITTTPAIGGNTCWSNPCENGALCFGNSDTYRCECAAGWSGPTCAVPFITITPPVDSTTTPGVGVCSPNPCYNGGVCNINADSSFMCLCTTAFTGTLCETAEVTILPPVTTPGVPMTCADQPCQNGGTCVAMGTSYSCFCGVTSGYTGKNCDSTTPMTVDECPLNCAPGSCIFSGNPVKPYACLWNGVMRPIDGTTG